MELPETASLLEPLPDNDVGENLEYDPAYMKMEELALSVPPAEMGDSVSAGREPNYRDLIKNTIALWGKTRDLRVAVYHTVAAFCVNGLAGMKQGLQMIDYLCKNLWDKCYPELDPDDDNDPTERLNIFSILSPKPGSYNDPIDFVGQFRKHRICSALPYTLRDALLAQGIIHASDDSASVDSAQMAAAFAALPRNVIADQYQLLSEVRELMTRIRNTVNDKIGSAASLNFEVLEKETAYLDKFLKSQISDSGEDSPAEEADGLAAGAVFTAGAAAAAVPRPAVKDISSLIVTNRKDALLLIGKSADYFRKAEPSSPLPFLLDRALRMSDMNFMEILREIDRNSLDRAREQLGVKEEDN
ncbi:type VI secretion system protein TssA [Succinimonas sp.]|uniref:type VI secretion system protein TssA n=1 Tax=Succinimonas sp. TaxID=1936151 RepID=UPI00386755CB